MKLLAVLLALSLHACSAMTTSSGAVPGRVGSSAQNAALLELADSIFAAARARDADRFSSFFSTRTDFVYLINRRRISSREALRTTFHSMLSGQAEFDVRWGERMVQVLTPDTGVITGEFRTTARRVNGEEWKASGVVTFVAVREAAGWRVVHWHTTE